PDLSSPRAAAAAATGPSGELYVVGGTLGGMSALDTVDVLAPAATSFAPGPTLVTGRASLAAAFAGGTLYAYGGRDIGGAGLNTLEALSGTWSPRASGPGGSNSDISAAGGLDGKFYFLDDGLYAYTPGTDNWVTLAKPVVGRDEAGLARGPDGLIYAI